MDFILVGLGNPGKTYEANRHNVGVMVVNAIAQKYGLTNYKDAFNSKIGQVVIEDKKVILLKPQTYMNLSGPAVMAVSHFYKIAPEKIIVIHDDLDLQLCKLKFKLGGGNGGHNGLKSIDSHLGTGYYRLRFGISHPGDKNMVSGFVLSDFTHDEQQKVEKMINLIVDNIGLLIKNDSANFLNYCKLQGA